MSAARRGKSAGPEAIRSRAPSTLDLIKGPPKSSAQSALDDVKRLLKQMRHTPRTEVELAKLKAAIQRVAEEKARIEREREEWEQKKEKLNRDRQKLRAEVQDLAVKHAQRLEDEEKRTFRVCVACNHHKMLMRMQEEQASAPGQMRRAQSLPAERLNYFDCYVPFARAQKL